MRLFIAEARKELRLALQMLLNQEAGLHVTGIAVETKGLVAQIAASEPDVLLLDWQLPGSPMKELVGDIRALELPLKIVVLSVQPEEEGAAMAAGADAFVSKADPPDQLMAVLNNMRQIPTDGAPIAREGE